MRFQCEYHRSYIGENALVILVIDGEKTANIPLIIPEDMQDISAVIEFGLNSLLDYCSPWDSMFHAEHYRPLGLGETYERNEERKENAEERKEA